MSKYGNQVEVNCCGYLVKASQCGKLVKLI